MTLSERSVTDPRLSRLKPANECVNSLLSVFVGSLGKQPRVTLEERQSGMGKPSDLVQGTLDLLILKTVSLQASTAGPLPNASSKFRATCSKDRSIPRSASIGAAGTDTR